MENLINWKKLNGKKQKNWSNGKISLNRKIG